MTNKMLTLHVNETAWLEVVNAYNHYLLAIEDNDKKHNAFETKDTLIDHAAIEIALGAFDSIANATINLFEHGITVG